ncbi:MAG: hypothetical protein CME60_06625 [Halobacteriovoraceae bacterium]|nr:hypothetical protein [Halobacteriovoraceae bacterium]
MNTEKSRLSPRKIISNLIIPSTKEVRAHKLVEGTPYPSRSPYGYSRLAATVIHVPKKEINHFLDVIVKRYIKTLKTEAFSFITRNKDFVETSDSELEQMIVHSVFCRFLNSILDPDDYEIFDPILKKQYEGEYLKIDLAHLDRMERIRPYHFCASKTLFRRNKNGVHLLGIYMNGLLMEPGDPDWERAKLFLIQGLCMSVLIHEHPKQHFGYDAINGLTKCLIPEGHIVHRLLRPHLYMQLPLNFAVLYVNKSVALNDQNEPYTCFPNTREGTIESLAASYEGIEGNSSYPRFKYKLHPEEIHFEFGEFLKGYWELTYQFVESFLIDMKRNDPLISAWAKDVSFFVPGFPNEEEIWKDNNLEKALTTFIYNVSFAHSADHYTYSKTKINQVPSRIRVRPPSNERRGEPLNKARIFNRTDLHKHHLAMEMFFKPTNLITILEATYPTKTVNERLAVEDFKDALELREENLKIPNYIPLSEVACSIQY